MNRNVLLGILAAAALVLAGGCLYQYHFKSEQESSSKTIFAMDTVMTVTANGKHAEEAVLAAEAEIHRLDALLSTENPDSEIGRINAGGSGAVSEDTEQIIKKALELYDSTGGLFDITIYPLMRLWGFPTGEYHVPEKEELQAAAGLADASRVVLEDGTVTVGEGQMLDLGGIAKGYTSARLIRLFREYGVSSGMVYLGGNVQVCGKKPDGQKWNIGIQDPDGAQGEICAYVSVADQAVVTSGGYERYFEQDGETYIHILDPRTGYPADQDLISVTVISADGMLADALSTSLYLMGLEDASAYWRSAPDDFDMVLITKNGELYATEGIRQDVHSDRTIQVIYEQEAEEES